MAHSPSLCILLGLPLLAAPVIKIPSPFFSAGASFFQMKSEHSGSTQRSSGENRQSPGHPTEPHFITKLAFKTHCSGFSRLQAFKSIVASSRKSTSPDNTHPPPQCELLEDRNPVYCLVMGQVQGNRPTIIVKWKIE